LAQPWAPAGRSRSGITDDPSPSRLARVVGSGGTACRAQVVVVPGARRWLAVAVGVVPRVERHLAPLDVGTAPADHVGRLLDQRLQALLRGRVGADIELVDVEIRADPAGDLLLGHVDARPPRASAARWAPPGR